MLEQSQLGRADCDVQVGQAEPSSGRRSRGIYLLDRQSGYSAAWILRYM